MNKQLNNTLNSLSPSAPQTQLSESHDLLIRGYEFNVERNKILNKFLSEKVDRDSQRRKHRNCLIFAVFVVCTIFYGLFIYLAYNLYTHIEILEKVHAVWITPVITLITVPTVLLIVLIFCVYRQKPNDIPKNMLDSIGQNSKDQ